MTHHSHDNGTPDQPVAQIVKDMSEQTQRLVRLELELARAELTQKGRKAGIGAGLFGGAGLLGFFAFAALTAAAILGLAELVPEAVAAVIVAVVYAAIAGVLALTGKKEVAQATPPAPERAMESSKEDVRYTTERAKEARR